MKGDVCMRFAHVTISVKNMEESLHFYEQIVGLPVKRKMSGGPGRELAFLGNENESEVELICGTQANPSFGRDISIGFVVENLDETIRHLQENGCDTGEVMSPNPSMKMIFITDPDGLRVQFMEQA